MMLPHCTPMQRAVRARGKPAAGRVEDPSECSDRPGLDCARMRDQGKCESDRVSVEQRCAVGQREPRIKAPKACVLQRLGAVCVAGCATGCADTRTGCTQCAA
eukprot:365484-Chlamydomonas_euryale.AAC.2